MLIERNSSDTTMHELKVRPEDLQACTEKSSGVDKMGKFKLGDMVQIDAQNVGVIVRLEKEAFQILNQRVIPCLNCEANLIAPL